MLWQSHCWYLMQRVVHGVHCNNKENVKVCVHVVFMVLSNCRFLNEFEFPFTSSLFIQELLDTNLNTQIHTSRAVLSSVVVPHTLTAAALKNACSMSNPSPHFLSQIKYWVLEAAETLFAVLTASSLHSSFNIQHRTLFLFLNSPQFPSRLLLISASLFPACPIAVHVPQSKRLLLGKNSYRIRFSLSLVYIGESIALLLNNAHLTCSSTKHCFGFRLYFRGHTQRVGQTARQPKERH